MGGGGGRRGFCQDSLRFSGLAKKGALFRVGSAGAGEAPPLQRHHWSRNPPYRAMVGPERLLWRSKDGADRLAAR